MIVGLDEVNKVVMVVGEPPPSLLAEGFKVVRLTQVPRILVDRKARYRPLVGGVSIGHVDVTAGTISCSVMYQNEPHLLSNAHVFHPGPWSPSPPARPEIVQPGPIDGGSLNDVVGKFIKHVPVKLEEESTCPLARLYASLGNAVSKAFGRRTRFTTRVEPENLVDCAIAEPVKDVLETSKMPVLMDDGSKAIPSGVVGLLFAGSEPDNIYVCCKAKHVEKELGVTFPYSLLEPVVGDKVYKSGRSTGTTQGDVLATSMTIKVFYGKGFALFKDQVVVRSPVAGGDSGSLVFATCS